MRPVPLCLALDFQSKTNSARKSKRNTKTSHKSLSAQPYY